MSIQRICDICGRPVGTIIERNPRYKVKKMLYGPFGGEWVTIDAHNECVEKLLQVKKKEEEDGN